MPKTDAFLNHIENPETGAIQRIQTILLAEMQSYAQSEGFVQLMPVLMSPFTDPLNHSVYPAEINYEDTRLKLTASMIFHKQLALIPHDINKIFIVSPNIRLEKAIVKNSDNHLLEFSQFDIEIKNADMDQAMDFMEAMLKHAFTGVKAQCASDLEQVGSQLVELDIDRPFPRYSSQELQARYGDTFEEEISRRSDTPCFVTNFKREFYDREDSDAPGTYRNFDLIYPRGFGEASSGAEREYSYDDIVRRMQELDMNLEGYSNYLELAQQGKIPRTAGAGIGMQRLMKFICNKRRIADVCLFDRSITTDFVF